MQLPCVAAIFALMASSRGFVFGGVAATLPKSAEASAVTRCLAESLPIGDVAPAVALIAATRDRARMRATATERALRIGWRITEVDNPEGQKFRSRARESRAPG